MITPLGNYALLEIVDEFKGLARNDAAEQQHKGVLRAFNVMADHLTESGGYHIDNHGVYSESLQALLGKVVYYQEYADSGRKDTINGVNYVMVPWYRIYAVETEGK